MLKDFFGRLKNQEEKTQETQEETEKHVETPGLLKPGQKTGLFTILSPQSKYNFNKYFCKCDCGNIRLVAASRLMTGDASCGECFGKRQRKSMASKTNHLSYARWKSMMDACYKKNHHAYASHGAVGIRVCERWHDFNNYVHDIGNDKPHRWRFVRKNKRKDFCPENCIWIEPCKLTKELLISSEKPKIPRGVGIELEPGQKVGKWTIINNMHGLYSNYKCRCECGIVKEIRGSTLKEKINNPEYCCMKCSYKKRFKKVKDKLEQKELVETIKENNTLEKLPSKLNINMPSQQSLDNYIEKAEELLANANGIPFESKFQDKNKGIILSWNNETGSNRFRLMVVECSEILYKDSTPPVALKNCDLRVKINACKHIKEFLELFEMHVSDYLDGKINK